MFLAKVLAQTRGAHCSRRVPLRSSAICNIHILKELIKQHQGAVPWLETVRGWHSWLKPSNMIYVC
jgi:hypothetical protein